MPCVRFGQIVLLMLIICGINKIPLENKRVGFAGVTSDEIYECLSKQEQSNSGSLKRPVAILRHHTQ